MMVEIKVPNLPDTVSSGTIATWHVKAGDAVSREQILMDLETNKAVFEVPATVDGTLHAIYVEAGQSVWPGDILGMLDDGMSPSPSPSTGNGPSSLRTRSVENPQTIQRETQRPGDISGSPTKARLFFAFVGLFFTLETTLPAAFFSGLFASVLTWLASFFVHLPFSSSQAGQFVALQAFICFWGLMVGGEWNSNGGDTYTEKFISFEQLASVAVIATLLGGVYIWLVSLITPVSTSPLQGGITFGIEVVLFLLGSIAGDRLVVRSVKRW